MCSWESCPPVTALPNGDAFNLKYSWHLWRTAPSLFEVRDEAWLFSIWSHPFDRVAIKVFLAEWKGSDGWITGPCLLIFYFYFFLSPSCISICYFLKRSHVLSPPISVMNWRSGKEACVNKCTSKMIMPLASLTGRPVIHLMWFVSCCITQLELFIFIKPIKIIRR